MDLIFTFLVEGALTILTVYLKMMLISAFWTAVLFIPYFAALYLEGFGGTIIANNWIFFAIIAAVVVFFKIYSYKTSNNFIVRTLFKLFFVTGITYIFLFVFKFDSVIYSITGVMNHYFSGEENVFIEISQNARFYEVTEGGHWFYTTLISLINKVIEFAKWSFGNVLGIDNSCFTFTAETFNILKILYACFSYLFLGGFAFIGTLLFSALILAGVALGVYIPYNVAFGITNTINILIYKHRFKKEYRSVLSKWVPSPFNLRKKEA